MTTREKLELLRLINAKNDSVEEAFKLGRQSAHEDIRRIIETSCVTPPSSAKEIYETTNPKEAAQMFRTGIWKIIYAYFRDDEVVWILIRFKEQNQNGFSSSEH